MPYHLAPSYVAISSATEPVVEPNYSVARTTCNGESGPDLRSHGIGASRIGDYMSLDSVHESGVDRRHVTLDQR